MDRDKALQSIRIQLNLPADASGMQTLLQFQNEVLRPILKFQHIALQMMIEDYASKKKVVLSELDEKKMITFLDKHLTTDLILKTQLIGTITGFFTQKELQFYLINRKEVNKRMNAMIIQRLKSIYEKKNWS